MNDWFATGAFDRNFVGRPFDPDEMLRQHRDGSVVAWMLESYE